MRHPPPPPPPSPSPSPASLVFSSSHPHPLLIVSSFSFSLSPSPSSSSFSAACPALNSKILLCFWFEVKAYAKIKRKDRGCDVAWHKFNRGLRKGKKKKYDKSELGLRKLSIESFVGGCALQLVSLVFYCVSCDPLILHMQCGTQRTGCISASSMEKVIRRLDQLLCPHAKGSSFGGWSVVCPPHANTKRVKEREEEGAGGEEERRKETKQKSLRSLSSESKYHSSNTGWMRKWQ